MLYTIILVDLNGYVQTYDTNDLKVISDTLLLYSDTFSVTYKKLEEPYMIVQKIVSNKTDKKISKLSDNYKVYNYTITKENIHYRFIVYDKELNKQSHEEHKYLDLMSNIIYFGDYRKTRNGFTYSLFGKSLEFDISESFPLLTTKKVFFRGIVEELIFFLHGKTDSKILEEKGINIWKPNTTNEFIKSRNLNYREGDMGPMYGFNWLHFGAKYNGCDSDYTNQGFNQLEQVIKLIKEDPMSRRIIMTTYNPEVAEEGVLYPCHGIVVQFYINKREDVNYLSCSMTQRSADVACGIPFNIASYATLVYILCKYLGENYKPDKLIMNLGDAHLYEEHINEALTQIKREPMSFPNLTIKDFKDFSELTYDHFSLTNYTHHDPIKFVMKP
jgi:thymidylate synthase